MIFLLLILFPLISIRCESENIEQECRITKVSIRKTKTRTKFWGNITLTLVNRLHGHEYITVKRCKYALKEQTVNCLDKFKKIKSASRIVTCTLKFDKSKKLVGSEFGVSVRESSDQKSDLFREKKLIDEQNDGKKKKEEVIRNVKEEGRTGEKIKEKEEEGRTAEKIKEKEEEVRNEKKVKFERRKGDETTESHSKPLSKVSLILVFSIILVLIGAYTIRRMSTEPAKPLHISRPIVRGKLPIESDPSERSQTIVRDIRKRKVYKRFNDDEWNQYVDDVLMTQFASEDFGSFFPDTPYALTYGKLLHHRQDKICPNILILWNGREEEYNPSKDRHKKQEFLGVRFHFQSDGGFLPFDVKKEEMMIQRRMTKFLEQRGVKSLGYRRFRAQVFLLDDFDRNNENQYEEQQQQYHLGSEEFEIFRGEQLRDDYHNEGDIEYHHHQQQQEEEEEDGEVIIVEIENQEEHNNNQQQQEEEEEYENSQYDFSRRNNTTDEYDLAQTRDKMCYRIFLGNTEHVLGNEDVKFARFVLENRKLVFSDSPFLYESKVLGASTNTTQRNKRIRLSFIFGDAGGKWLVVVIKKDGDRQKLLKESNNRVSKASDSIRGWGKKITRLGHTVVTFMDLDESLKSLYNQS